MQSKIKAIEQDKSQLVEQRTRTIELEKEKLAQLHRMDLDQLKQAHERELQALKDSYQKEHDSLARQLEQQQKMN